MIKTLKLIEGQEHERINVPKSAQQAIPVKRIWSDGIFLVGRNKYSKTYAFSDINYSVASREDKEGMFLDYSELLNSFDSGATTKITIINGQLSEQEFEETVLIPLKDDGLDEYREELNSMFRDSATQSNAIIQNKFITVSVVKKSIDEARSYFARTGAELSSHLAKLGSKCKELSASERLRIFHGFYRKGEESSFHFDMKDLMRKGHDFKDFICPDSLEFEKDHFRVNDRFGRVLFLREYASYIKDSMVAELTESNKNIVMSIDVVPIPTDEAVKEVESRLLGVETNITNWQRKQNQQQNFSAIVPYDMEQQRKESREFLSDITSRDQRMMFANVTVLITADSMEELESDTEAFLTTARKHLCQFAVLKFQQLDGLNTVLPFGVRKVNALRTLTTESLAVLMPFRVQEVRDKGGIFCGVNALSHNLIMCNKASLMNPNEFRLGVPGSGKSMGAKFEMIINYLMTDDDILICDPENEYGEIGRALGGTVIDIAAGGSDHINAMDMDDWYGEGSNPVVDKAEFALALFQRMEPERKLDAVEKSIIDRCTAMIYGKNRGASPTLFDLKNALERQHEPEAKRLALALEMHTKGSLNTFAHSTNVDYHNRLVIYNMSRLGREQKGIGHLVITDAMRNRVAKNWKLGKRTHLIFDEFHVMYEDEHTATFFNSAWRQFRKRNGFPTGITQNVEYLLDSITAKTMLSNSEFIVMHKQSSSDRDRLAELLDISNEQIGFITNTDAGGGLLKIGDSLVPFKNPIPAHTKLYRLMTTKPGE